MDIDGILKTLKVGGLYGDRGDSHDRALAEAKVAIEQLLVEARKEVINEILGPDSDGDYMYIDIDDDERREWHIEMLAKLDKNSKPKTGEGK